MATYVLVSGAWHAAWCWELIVPRLESLGDTALAPDLLGMGRDKTPLSEVSLARWADQVSDIIRGQDEPVVLVGHSRGGLVISEVAERVPDRIKTLVYLSAVLIPDGSSIADITTPFQADHAFNMFNVQPDGMSTVSSEGAAELLYNTTDADLIDRAISLLGPEPMSVHAEKVSLSVQSYGRVPRAYIELKQDMAILHARQKQMQEVLPCDPVIEMDTDHSPFYCAPDALVAVLRQIAGA